MNSNTELKPVTFGCIGFGQWLRIHIDELQQEFDGHIKSVGVLLMESLRILNLYLL